MSCFACIAYFASAKNELLERSGAIKALKITSLRVNVLAAKNLVMKGEAVSGSCFCLVSLENQEGTYSNEKTNARQMDDELMIWTETFTLRPILTLEAVLRIRIFESSLLSKDQFVCEIRIPLSAECKLDPETVQPEGIPGSAEAGGGSPRGNSASSSHAGQFSRKQIRRLAKSTFLRGGEKGAATIGYASGAEIVAWHRFKGRATAEEEALNGISGGDVLLGLTLCC